MTNEFIVWDKRAGKFIEDFSIDNSDFSCFVYDDYGRCDYFEDFTIHQFTGKKDINDNKIYSDCSIFNYKYYDGEEWLNDIGYMEFDDEELRYMICGINSREMLGVNSFISDIENIDTIQENKLGLFKLENKKEKNK